MFFVNFFFFCGKNLVISGKIANFVSIYIVTELKRGRKTETFIINDIKKTYNNMKKRLLLFAAVLSASANFMFAQNNTSAPVTDRNGNTYSYDTVRDLDANSEKGDTVYANEASFDINPEQYKMTLKSDLRVTVINANLTYNVKLTNASENPGTIAPFTERMKSQSTIYEIGTKEEDIVYTRYDGIYVEAYTPKTNTEAFAKYLVACNRAKAIQPSVIYSGVELKAAKWNNTVVRRDDDGVDIVDDLYYMVFRRNKFLPILNIDGDYARGVTYNGCYVTYNPVGIADGYHSYSVSGDGKVGYVSGVIDNGKVEEILSNTSYAYVNFDFTNASILGSVNTNVINDNRIAYFNKNTDVAGQNFVVGTSCERYYIYDNNQEIYVDRSFSAEDSRYHRTFTHDTYGSIVLPFTVSSTSDIFVKQATLTSYVPSENKLTFTSMSAIAPNTPYMIKVLSTVDGERTLYGDVNGTVQATRDAQTDNFNGAKFIGTFEGLDENEVANVYIVGAPGKIGRTKAPLKPGRCYLTREENSNAKIENATIEIIDEDGSIETIKGDEVATAIDGVVNGEVVSVQYISVNGQVSNEPFSGINIVKKTFADGSVETSKVTF